MCAGKCWTTAAASIGAVEALKDQGHLCRWNSAVRALSQPNKLSSSSASSSSAAVRDSSEVKREDHSKAKQSEESLRTVMYLSCWGPY